MGYNGKPSQGCETCRKRKIGCDKLTPSCTQCNRSGRPCPGYRDPLSLHFRDVTEQVMRKEQARTSETPESSSSSSEHSPDTSTNTIVRRRAGSRKTHASARLSRNASLIETGAGADPPPRADVDMDQDTVHNFVYYPFVTGPLVRPTKEEAVCYFLHAHDFPGSPFITRNVTTLISARKSLGQRALESGIAAASLALMSRARDVHALRYTACQEYVTALKLVNRTLADPKEAKTDQALAAVTMLALYEVRGSEIYKGSRLTLTVDLGEETAGTGWMEES
ncbi:hypothetical protein N7532_003306 [Penicillium argentinense]|uniref:Zn(2)-C6 fungal-type domain-containing protein n=1 Tax=Penicillium argentinense TaxID=1131581 RepID=A0A9W9FM97_9EURO|nr:uncharacterized protein N7532_003306 [Penicillium argentinense]KAJ5102777.1 hypothetical protein N7532_003306 [Penicillium argentinense]